MLIEHYFNPEHSEFPSFLLDCSHYPSVISLGQELGKSDVLSHLHHLSRTCLLFPTDSIPHTILPTVYEDDMLRLFIVLHQTALRRVCIFEPLILCNHSLRRYIFLKFSSVKSQLCEVGVLFKTVRSRKSQIGCHLSV